MSSSSNSLWTLISGALFLALCVVGLVILSEQSGYLWTISRVFAGTALASVIAGMVALRYGLRAIAWVAFLLGALASLMFSLTLVGQTYPRTLTLVVGVFSSALAMNAATAAREGDRSLWRHSSVWAFVLLGIAFAYAP